MHITPEQYAFIASGLLNEDVDVIREFAKGMVRNQADIMADMAQERSVDGEQLPSLPDTRDVKEATKEFVTDVMPDVVTQLKKAIDDLKLTVNMKRSIVCTAVIKYD